jgi:ElaA protein
MASFALKAFAEMSPDELYDVLALRQQVFVVEQACAYLDCDELDRGALHLMGRGSEGLLVAYARLLPPGLRYAEASIGRVVTHRHSRRSGLGRRLMGQAIARVRERFGDPIRIGAQRYLEEFYRSIGFVPVGEPYDEDGIPHVEMMLG